jgi:hypothetical protein
VGGLTVEVLNGTTRTSLAHVTANKIAHNGYRIGNVGDQRPLVAKSIIFYRPGRRADALGFQKRFPEFMLLRESPALPRQTTLRVVIGADYPSSG